MTDEMKATKAMADAAVAVAQYAGSDAMNQMDEMLSQMADVYRNRLADVTVEELVRIQSCLRQTLAIRGVIRGTQQLPTI
jgi:hypothetical protein